MFVFELWKKNYRYIFIIFIVKIIKHIDYFI